MDVDQPAYARSRNAHSKMCLSLTMTISLLPSLLKDAMSLRKRQRIRPEEIAQQLREEASAPPALQRTNLTKGQA